MIKVSFEWIKQCLSLADEQIHNLTTTQLTTEVIKFSSDSRTIEAGHVFVALSGPNFDSNLFIQDVKDKGAVAVIVDKLSPVDIPQFVVNDTLKAYGLIAAKVAASVKPKTIAITGSVGKTSVKEMCAAILSQKGKVLATKGNFNNEIGVPHTLLELNESHDYAVIELGANHIGEIAYTSNLTKPDVAILNNVAEAHLEGFGDIHGVVRAKGEIFSSLEQNGVAIVNGDSEYKEYWLSRLNDKFVNSKGNIIQFGLNDSLGCEDNCVTASNIQLNKLGCATFTLHIANQKCDIELVLPGKHNVSNALAAAAACFTVGASLQDIQTGLLAMASVKGRVNLHQVTDTLLVIDDTYNANVQSAKAAIDLLSGFKGKRIFVLGDMAELGSNARRYHQDIGEYALEKQLDILLSIGVLSQSASSVMGEGGEHFSNYESLVVKLNQIIKQSDMPISVLVKGSRSAKMEQIVEQIIADNTN